MSKRPRCDLAVPRRHRAIGQQNRQQVQEADGEYLSGVRDVYLDLASTSPDWVQIPCERNGQLRSVDDISDAVFQTVTQRLRETSQCVFKP